MNQISGGLKDFEVTGGNNRMNRKNYLLIGTIFVLVLTYGVVQYIGQYASESICRDYQTAIVETPISKSTPDPYKNVKPLDEYNASGIVQLLARPGVSDKGKSGLFGTASFVAREQATYLHELGFESGTAMGIHKVSRIHDCNTYAIVNGERYIFSACGDFYWSDHEYRKECGEEWSILYHEWGCEGDDCSEYYSK